MSHSWLSKTPQQLLKDHFRAHKVLYSSISVSVYIIDSKKVFLLSKKNYTDAIATYTVPEFRLSAATEKPQQAMEAHAFKLMQPFIESHTLQQIHLVDLAFDKPLLNSVDPTSKNNHPTLPLTLTITATNGLSITPSWIQSTFPSYTSSDFIDASALHHHLPDPHQHLSCRAALTRHKNLLPRLKNIHGAGVAETPAFRAYCIRALTHEIRAMELRTRTSLAQGYLCLYEEDGKLYLVPVADGQEMRSKRQVYRGGEEWEVIGKWKDGAREEWGAAGVTRPVGDLLQLWWSCFGAEGALRMEWVFGVGSEGEGWEGREWREDARLGEVGGVPSWARRGLGGWVLQSGGV